MAMRLSRGAPIAATATAAVLLLALAPLPGAAVATLRNAADASDAGAPLLALIALTAWLLLGWLAVVTALAGATRLPGAVGCAAGVVAQRVAPAAVRRIVETALGLTVAVGALGASPALADATTPAVPPAPPAAASLDWPTPPESLDWNPASPATAATATPAAPAQAPRAAATAPVVVQLGDSLWAVAADHLPAEATDAQIAAAWPAWWAANRDAVGPDPDLIAPGHRLTPPAQS